MKRGRPNIRREVQNRIVQILTTFSTPVTTSTISKEISKLTDHDVSWNTVNKYIQELVEAGKIQPLPLPHSKISAKDGLIVYTLKK
ncbi:MAG: hypothetical protein HYT70_00945 [Candidatus Aenigmarchaeota archaeon]|nr:hypothetical protein [Candidatus Aenigmarchaeota archaeon]